MNRLEEVRKIVGSWPMATAYGDRILVPTHCLYPSNGSVMVTIEGGASSYIAHDDRGACDEVEAGGSALPGIVRLMSHIVTPQGLEIDASGVVRSRIIPQGDLLATIILVANTSKEVAHELITRFKPRAKKNFRRELAALLEMKFPNAVRKDVPLIGASNKPHRFHHVIRLPSERQLVLDAVVNDPSSVNAVVIAHLDLQNLKDTTFEQRIIYDDSEEWNAADLNLLSIGATTVPFSRASDVLDRIAA